MATTPRIVDISIGVCLLYTRKPKIIAITMNNIETIATDAFESVAT